VSDNAFQAALVAAQKATSGQKPTPSVTPSAASQAIAKAEAEALARAQSGDDEPEEPTEGETPEAPETEETPEVDEAPEITTDLVKDLLSRGKFEKLAELVGLEKGSLGAHPGAIRKSKKRLEEIERREESIRTKEQSIESKLQAANARFARHVALETAASQEDWVGLAKHIEALLPQGVSFGKLTQLIAQSTVPRTPTEERLARELEQLKKQLAPKPEPPEVKRSKDVSKLGEKLASHPGASLEDFPELVYRALEKEWDPQLKAWKRSLKTIADEVYKRERARAEKLLGKTKTNGKATNGKPKRPAPKPSVRNSNGQFATPTSPKGRDAFASAYQEAQRLVAASQRGRH
jgi:hypothetical protein